MKKLSKYSKLLHWITFLCLCLPFFYTGCKKAEEAPTPELVQQIDTSSVNTAKANKILLDNKSQDNLNKATEKVEVKTNEKEETISEALSKKYTFIKPILVSKENTFSGLAVIIDSGISIVFFGLFLYLLLSLLSLIVKYLESNGIKTIVLLDVLALFFLTISRPYAIISELLWGFWIAIILFSILTILDIYILIKFYKSLRKDCVYNKK